MVHLQVYSATLSGRGRYKNEREGLTSLFALSYTTRMESVNYPGKSSEHPTASTGLLLGVKQMDADSWSRLVTTFAPVVYVWCRSSAVPAADVPDLVQNVFVAVARGIIHFERCKEQGSFRSWLATITRNQVRDYFRQAARREMAEGGTDAWQLLQQQPAELDSTISPDHASAMVHHRALESVRAEFESVTWQAFWRTVVDGRATADVAAELGISVVSVYQAKSRILRRLRQRLEELPE